MQICRHCEEENPDGVTFCLNCGGLLADEPGSDRQPEPEPERKPDPTPVSKTEPTPEPVFRPEPAPEPEPVFRPEPAPEPEPEPVFRPEPASEQVRKRNSEQVFRPELKNYPRPSTNSGHVDNKSGSTTKELPKRNVDSGTERANDLAQGGVSTVASDIDVSKNGNTDSNTGCRGCLGRILIAIVILIILSQIWNCAMNERYGNKSTTRSQIVYHITM